VPLAVMLNRPSWPACTVWAMGPVVMLGAMMRALTLSVAGSVVALPALLLKMAVSPSFTAWLTGSLEMVRISSIAMNVSARLLCGRTFWRYVLRIIIELQTIPMHAL
jgi:hypothetical protein